MKNYRKVVPISEMRGDSIKDRQLLHEMYVSAERFLCSFDWCDKVLQAFFGLGIGGVVAVFLFRIQPNQPSVDRMLWVVVGDLPPAYLVTDKSPTPQAALMNYILEMRRWIEAVRKGKSVDKAIPVNVPPTRLWARRLEKRLNSLEAAVLDKAAASVN